MHEKPPDDITIDESKYVRMPVKLLWAIFGIWAVMVWTYSDLRIQIADNKKTVDAMARREEEDHASIIEMHDEMLKFNDFAEETRRVYNRYFRDYTDPDRRTK